MSAYSEQAAAEYIAKYSYLSQNAEDLALRVYTSRLIGQDQKLVLHGGGNTSVKLKYKTLTGEVKDVLAVKGSGWDLSNIEPQGFPQVDLAHLLALKQLPSLSDENMVNEVKGNMMDVSSPTPSIESLLHAYLPHKWIDHSHADAVLAVMNQKDAVGICRKIYGDKVGIVPYIMPGFELAKAAAKTFEENPKVEALLLLKHGVFTFGATARESYENHIRIVDMAEKFLENAPKRPLSIRPTCCCGTNTPEDIFSKVAPLLRGGLYKRNPGTGFQRWIVQLRTNPLAVQFASSEEAGSWSQLGPLTPDHVIRTKGMPMLLRDLPLDNEAALREHIEKALDTFANEYDAYFASYNEVFVKSGKPKKQLDKLPRVVLVEGAGIVAIGRSVSECQISADIYEHTIPMILSAQSVGDYEPPCGQDLFDIEYWSLEQAKLGKAALPPLQGSVVYVTGAASGIGFETSRAFARQGAIVVLSDCVDSLSQAVEAIKREKGTALGVHADVTNEASVAQSFARVVREFGGVDIIVSNAGRAPPSVLIGDCTTQVLKEQMELNFFAHQYVSSNAVRVMLSQLSGGCLLYNASKAALNPGPKMGPYAISKAAVISLMRQYALEYAYAGIRANSINADRVRTNLFTSDVIEARAKARNTTPDEYFKVNLLGAEVKVEDVAKGFVDLALSFSTTAAILTVDGGNIAASVR